MSGQLLLIALLLSAGNVTIDGVYPNPATDGDVGEFVIVTVGADTGDEPFTLTDGEDTIPIPQNTSTDTVILTDEPDVATRISTIPVHVVPQFLSLSNSGETLKLRRGNRTVATLSYERAQEAERFDGEQWTPIGRSSYEPKTRRSVRTTAFSLPDSNSPIHTALERADERVYLGAYTFSDPTIADRLEAAHDRGATVGVLVDESPVGGTTKSQVKQVNRLVEAGIPVRTMGGPQARYSFHHAKYAVVDDTVIVTSENWKPGGTGGHGSRGWGVVVEDPKLADHLASVFEADRGWNDTARWATSRPTEVQSNPPDTASFPSRFEPGTTSAESATVLLAPDNAGGAVRETIAGATRSIYVQQVSIDQDGVLLEETIAAARRGVRVKILLSGAWYVKTENRQLASSLRQTATEEDLPLSVRVIEPRSRFEHVHNKGMIVDGNQTLVGSLNWNSHALNENREVAVLVSDPAIAEYYERVFLADWRGAVWRVQWTLLGGMAGFLIIASIIARRYATFEQQENLENT